jgi:hypothetical protein
VKRRLKPEGQRGDRGQQPPQAPSHRTRHDEGTRGLYVLRRPAGRRASTQRVLLRASTETCRTERALRGHEQQEHDEHPQEATNGLTRLPPAPAPCHGASQP